MDFSQAFQGLLGVAQSMGQERPILGQVVLDGGLAGVGVALYRFIQAIDYGRDGGGVAFDVLLIGRHLGHFSLDLGVLDLGGAQRAIGLRYLRGEGVDNSPSAGFASGVDK